MVSVVDRTGAHILTADRVPKGRRGHYKRRILVFDPQPDGSLVLTVRSSLSVAPLQVFVAGCPLTQQPTAAVPCSFALGLDEHGATHLIIKLPHVDTWHEHFLVDEVEAIRLAQYLGIPLPADVTTN